MRRILGFWLNFLVVLTLTAADEPILSRKLTTDVTPLVEFPGNTNIVMLTTDILKRSHYSRRDFDNQVSSQFLDRYLDSLDNLHLYFFESDLKDFEKYRYELDELTTKLGDSTPARVIFSRFRDRLHQQYDYVTNLLYSDPFDFTGSDRFTLDRKRLPRPKDLAEAKKLWRDRVRYEFLQEKLGIGQPETIAQIVTDKLKQKKAKEIVPALEDKLSKEKAAEIGKLIEQKLDKEKPEQIAKAVLAKLESENVEEIRKIIIRRYTRVLRMINDYDNDDVLQIYLTALCHVYDPHSDYMGKAELENFSISMKLSLFGIGALLRSEDGICRIESLTGGGPAEKSGKLKPKDKIVGVAQSTNDFVDVVDMKLSKVVELIRGPKDTEVRLKIIPADAADSSARKVVSIIRDEIKLEDQAAKAKIIEMPLEQSKAVRLGVIDLPSFYSSFELEGRRGQSQPKSTTTDVAKLIRKLVQEKVSGIILDLRRNGGGSLEEAINLTGLFIKEGPVVQVRDPDGRVVVDSDPEPTVFYDEPLVVLTSRFSASASEILAGALQDYGRAVVVGDISTHGKGTVQSLLQLAPIMRQRGIDFTNNPGALKITIRKFYRASGASTQLEGVTPDIVLPSVNNYADIGERSLDNALPYDTIRRADYEKFNRVELYLPELKRRSEMRLASDRDFAYEREEIERYKKAIADKSVSLNEAERIREKKEADERAKARKKELAARAEPNWKIYEITLKEVDQPGLPPPVTKTNRVASVQKGNEVTTAAGERTDRLVKPSEKAPGAGQVADAKPTGHPAGSEADEDDAISDEQVSVDIPLEETKRILLDYIMLSSKGYTLSGTSSARAGQ
jgi:carboxyl-terminal processing protease